MTSKYDIAAFDGRKMSEAMPHKRGIKVKVERSYLDREWVSIGNGTYGGTT